MEVEKPVKHLASKHVIQVGKVHSLLLLNVKYHLSSLSMLVSVLQNVSQRLVTEAQVDI